MPRSCTICTHASRGEIDQALASNSSNLSVASLFAVSEQALRRHKGSHLPARVAKAQEVEDVREALDVIKQLKAINSASLNILKEAREQGKQGTALAAIDRIHRQIELQAKLLGELDDSPTVNITISAEWIELRAVIVAALAPHHEARSAVLRAMEGAGNGSA